MGPAEKKDYGSFSEKISLYGPRSLDDSELLAMILSGNSKDPKKLDNYLQLSKTLIENHSLRGLLNNFTEAQQFIHTVGLPKLEANYLTSISELFRRTRRRDHAELNNAHDAFKYFSDMQHAQREQVRVACINFENFAFYSETISIGTENSTHCPLISIFNPPIRLYSKRIIIAHNHPRGLSKPSPQDLDWHRKLIETALALGIEIIDHIIIGETDYFSFASAGLME